ncbi:sodium:proton antiporter [Adlercreutzia sp. R25]|uniref:Sodium:proton antiporter n=1 Tax=Adlercreutzia shanghongiae TaxID=3111773 RepID=A0ABU6IY30_9ACTN|nr:MULTISPECIES: sodium:proton antiporter [unclassified Adlercreutzia]MEC4272487.1 sodium:proton antiporter [Adlercreutzia sp. R25]MEC4294613.1 sodium:proton antiporter [Adlercreutzia sp. R22]
MEALTLGLLLLAAVLASSLIDQIIPRVSLPLIQIAIGLVIAVVAGGEVEVTLDPDLFLVMFIAPLLYDEAKHADKQALWRERKPVLSLAIGLVVATTLVIGFLLHAFVPSIPLAAAFALGAALGPTDAVAVSSLSKQVNIPQRQASMLKGELLLNDASGIVSFQFAIAAVVTGSFSLAHASVDFLVEFVGGLLLGIVLGLVGNGVVKRARSIGVENTNFHVLFEVLIPFLIYLVANVCHVSGVIAVVVAGLINVTSPKGVIGPSVSRMNIVSGSVWHVLTYALNGIVFVLLGTQLPLAMQDTWENVRITNSTLILLVFGLTFILLATRFVWVLAMDLIHVRAGERRAFRKSDLRSALITTFSGAKGTITLSIMFSIPTYAIIGPPNVPFPQRELLIFLACGVIVCTLLLATFVVPLLAPARDGGEEELRRINQDAATTMDIMRNVIEMLTAQQTRQNRAETQAVIHSYNERLARIKENNGIEDELNVELRVQALTWEYERAMELTERGVVSGVVAYRYMGRLEQAMQLLQHGRGRGHLRRWNSRFRALLHRGVRAILRELPGSGAFAEQTEEMRWLQTATRTYAIEHLEAAVASSQVPTEDAATVLVEYQRSVAALHSVRPTVTSVIKVDDRAEDIKRKAYAFELEQIQDAYEGERLSRSHAQRMRESVQLMQMDLEDTV